MLALQSRTSCISNSTLQYIDAAGGSIHRDEHLMRKLYGQDVLMSDIVAGRVPLPPEVRIVPWLSLCCMGLLPSKCTCSRAA